MKEWDSRGVKKGLEYAILTDEITKAWSGFSSKEKKPKTFKTSKKIAKQGGTIAGNTRKEIEEKTGKRVISSKNANELQSKSVKKKSNETK